MSPFKTARLSAESLFPFLAFISAPFSISSLTTLSCPVQYTVCIIKYTVSFNVIIIEFQMLPFTAASMSDDELISVPASICAPFPMSVCTIFSNPKNDYI